MIKMKGLGRGLDALLSGSDKPHGDDQRNLPVERLKPGKYQPAGISNKNRAIS